MNDMNKISVFSAGQDFCWSGPGIKIADFGFRLLRCFLSQKNPVFDKGI